MGLVGRRIDRAATAAALVAAVVSWPAAAGAQAGVLLVEGTDAPDPTVLSLAEMDVEVRIDHFHAAVELTQVFENRTDRTLRGRYELVLGRGAALSGLALWDGERRRLAAVAARGRPPGAFAGSGGTDPDLLEVAEEGPGRSVYAVRVDSLEPFQRVRVEASYSLDLDLAGDEAVLVVPLARPERGEQRAGRLTVRLEVSGVWPLRRVALRPERAFRVESPLEASEMRTGLRAVLDRRDEPLPAEVAVVLGLDRRADGVPPAPALLAYREPSDSRGYFVLAAPMQLGSGGVDDAEGSQDVVIALDASLSMRGAKLERAADAVEGLLERLRPGDRFALMMFNDRVAQLPGGLGPATAERRAAARQFFRSGSLSGGTDLLRAVPAALALLSGSRASRRTVVLITDGQPSLAQLGRDAIAEAAVRANDELGASRGRLFVLGVGDDADHRLLERLARQSTGLYAAVGEGGAIDEVLRGFLAQLGARALADVRLEVEGAGDVEDLYPEAAARVLDGTAHVVYGRYVAPAPAASFRLRGLQGAAGYERLLIAPLPRQDIERPWIARSWARRRVDDLLSRIEASGERREWVEEVVALAGRHLFVTPYTSFLSAARSVLRPREIPPGDPVLRVRTDPTDHSVTALLPFGEIRPLRRLEPGLFETRFIAPPNLADGRYGVDLVVAGRDGRRRLVREHFVIDSRAPRPIIDPLAGPARAGERVALRARADSDTRRLTAYLRAPGQRDGAPAELRWNDADLACTGSLSIDPATPTGTYQLVVVAEDRAHNVGTTATTLEIVGR
jgi:Ca-activated chloride channel family protein